MELPYGITIEEVKEIVNDWNRIYDDVENNRIDLRQYNDDGCKNFACFYEDNWYIDRYMETINAEFCITTSKEDDATYLSEYVKVFLRHEEGCEYEDVEEYGIDELEEMIKGCE